MPLAAGLPAAAMVTRRRPSVGNAVAERNIRRAAAEIKLEPGMASEDRRRIAELKQGKRERRSPKRILKVRISSRRSLAASGDSRRSITRVAGRALKARQILRSWSSRAEQIS